MSKEQIDEIAKLICNFPQCVCYNSIGECANTECQIVDKAEALYNAGYRKQSEWISVEERLPEREGKYLVYTIKGGIKFGDYRSYLVGEGKLCEPQFDYYVTHWMPLPEAPKMKGGEE